MHIWYCNLLIFVKICPHIAILFFHFCVFNIDFISQKVMCLFYNDGTCRYGATCRNVHADVCDICNRPVLFVNDTAQNNGYYYLFYYHNYSSSYFAFSLSIQFIFLIIIVIFLFSLFFLIILKYIIKNILNYKVYYKVYSKVFSTSRRLFRKEGN
jgi:hypothetical protein